LYKQAADCRPELNDYRLYYNPYSSNLSVIMSTLLTHNSVSHRFINAIVDRSNALVDASVDEDARAAFRVVNFGEVNLSLFDAKLRSRDQRPDACIYRSLVAPGVASLYPAVIVEV